MNGEMKWRFLLWLTIGALPGQPVRADEPSAMLLRLVQQVDVPAREAGLLAAVHVREGQLVSEAELLALIDDTEARLEKEQAESEAEIARANAANDVDLRYARKSVEVSRAELRRAEQSNQHFARSVSESEMDRLQLVLERNALAVEQSEHERTIRRLNLDAQESRVRSAEERVQRHRLQAPFDGLVVQLQRQAGEWVTPGEPVIRVVRMDRLRAEGFLPAEYVSPDLQGTAVRLQVTPPNASPHDVPGHIVFVDPEIDPVNAQIRIWVEIENPELRLRPGMRAWLNRDQLQP